MEEGHEPTSVGVQNTKTSSIPMRNGISPSGTARRVYGRPQDDTHATPPPSNERQQKVSCSVQYPPLYRTEAATFSADAKSSNNDLHSVPEQRPYSAEDGETFTATSTERLHRAQRAYFRPASKKDEGTFYPTLQNN